MVIHSIDALLAQEINSPQRRPMAVAGAGDSGVLEAVSRAQKEGVVQGLLFGDQSKILSVLDALGEAPEDYEIFHADSDEQAAFLAVQAVREGAAQFLMKGLLNTATLLREVVNKDTGINTGGIISHLMLMELPAYPKLLAVTDVGIIPAPTLEQKQGIIDNAVRVFHNLGYKNPKVAALSYVENVNPKVQETVEARELQKMAEQGAFAGALVEGPLSFDVAMDKKRADIKGYVGEVPGDADILLMPNISAGNILVKALGQFVPHMHSVAFAVGSHCPIVLTSRATPTQGKYRSIVAAAAACGNAQ